MKNQIRRAAEHLLAYPFRVWGFGEGIGVRALLEASSVLGDPRYEGFVRGLFSAWLGRGGPKGPEDHVAPGYELLALYERTGDPALLEAARRLASLHAGFPRHDGIRLHRADQPGWKRQIWVDCMHVDGPFLARLGRITGEAEFFDEAAGQVLAYARVLQEPGGLFRHGWEAACGVNGELWARGNGWALTGMIDTLAELPADHPSAAEIRDRVERLLRALAAHRTADGLWHTVIVDDSTYQETTLAAMVAMAVRRDPPHSVESVVLRHVGASGELLLTSEATPVCQRHVYATRPFGVFPWGQGPLVLLLCALEQENQNENRQS